LPSATCTFESAEVAGALMITADGLFTDRLDQIVALAKRY
jgi:hypothetical protein